MEDGCCYERWWHMKVHSTTCLSQYNVLFLDRGQCEDSVRPHGQVIK